MKLLLDLRHKLCSYIEKHFSAPVAQLDRAPDYESGGLGFKSLQVCHFPVSFEEGLLIRLKTSA